MKDALLHAIGAALDGLEVGFCAFDHDDRTLAWNHTFLEFFPEHDGHVHVGEPYAQNLRRFYDGRLKGEARARMDELIAEGIARHRSQRRPFEFDQRDFRVRVSSVEMGRFGRLRVWRKVALLPSRSAAPAVAARPSAAIDTAAVLERLADGVVIVDVAERIVWANAAFCALYGLRAADAAGGRAFEDVYREAWGGAPDPAGLRALEAGRRYAGAPFELRLPGERWVRVVEQRGEIDGRGTFVHVDITTLKRQQQALADAEARYRLVAEYSSDIILALQGGRVTYVSPAVTDMLGWQADEVLGQTLVRFCHPDDIGAVTVALGALHGQPQADYRARALHRDGSHVWVEARARRLPDAPGAAEPRLVINVRSIAARKQVEDELEQAQQRLMALATRDGLTGIANRRQLDETLAAECRRAAREHRPVSLLMMDIDNFKRLNDGFGHPAGDEVLRRIAAALAGLAHRAGDLAARYGGEEFCLLLPETGGDAALCVAERARAAVAALDLADLGIPGVTVSVGIASAVQTTPDALVAAADAAMYRAKRAGKNCVVRAGDPPPPQARAAA